MNLEKFFRHCKIFFNLISILCCEYIWMLAVHLLDIIQNEFDRIEVKIQTIGNFVVVITLPVYKVHL